VLEVIKDEVDCDRAGIENPPTPDSGLNYEKHPGSCFRLELRKECVPILISQNM
jgi:hypothetical protein